MNFDSIISEALKQGLSVSDIASSINSSLDKAYKQEEDKKAKSAEVEKQSYIANLIELCRSGNYSYDVAAAHATMAVSVANKDWSLKQLKSFYNSVVNSCTEAAKIVAKNEEDITYSSVSISSGDTSSSVDNDTTNFFDNWAQRFLF